MNKTKGTNTMKKINGTVTENLTVCKTVQIEVPDHFTDCMVKDAIEERAYVTTIAEYEPQHGWSGVETCDVGITWEEVSVPENLPYSVDAGRYDEYQGNLEINTKYSDAFATLDEALAAFDECKSYPWQRLSYKSRVLMEVNEP